MPIEQIFESYGNKIIAPSKENNSGSGGHTILNPSGTEMDQEDKLQFKDAHISDDSTNSKTIVENFKAVTEAEYSQQTEDGAYIITDGDGATIGPASEDYVEVEGDGEKTYKTLLNELHTLIDSDKISDNAILKLNGLIHNPIVAQNGEYYFSRVNLENNLPATFEIGVLESNSYYNIYQNDQYTNKSNDAAPVGRIITLYYGQKKAVVDLQTTANRCLMPDGTTNVAQALGTSTLIATLDSAGDTTLSESILNFALIGIQVTDPDIYAPFMTIPSSILYNATENANICIVAYKISTSAISNIRIWYNNSTDKIIVRSPAKVYGIIRKA